MAALGCWGFARSGEAELMPVAHGVSGFSMSWWAVLAQHWRGCGLPHSGDTQEQSGCNPEQCAIGRSCLRRKVGPGDPTHGHFQP